MKTIFKTADYKILFNGSKTFCVVTKFGDCLIATSTERKARNFLARTMKMAGLS